MKNRSSCALAALLFLIVASSAGCDVLSVDDRPDPNGPSLEGVLDNATRDQIANLAVGIESATRIDLDLYLIDVGMVGRELWRTSAAEPRFTSDLLGQSPLNDNTFYITRPWAARYRVVRNSHILIDALENTQAISEEEKNAARGFANTFIAHQLLLNLNLTFQNGVRVDVANTDNLGPVVGYEEALASIASFLDEGLADLEAGGTAFPFALSSGFDGLRPANLGDSDADPGDPVTTDGFAQFNRALAARVALYQGDYAGALSLLGDSFLDADGDLFQGAYHVFSTAPGDLANPIFITPDAAAGDAVLGHPSFAEDIAADDERISKVFDRGEPTTFDNLTTRYGFFRYKTQLDPIPIVRNAELVLIRAESRIQTGDLEGAVEDLNTIRNAASLDDYDGPVTAEALTDEMLRQRRFELYGEGHRWIDVRRYDRLDALPLSRAEDNVWTQFPVPAAENTGADS